MEMNQHCLDTLRKLAQGIDPRSGLPLPGEDACQAPEVIRALFQAIQALEAQGKVRPPPEQAGKPWSEEEEQALLQRFDEMRHGATLVGVEVGRRRSSAATVRVPAPAIKLPRRRRDGSRYAVMHSVWPGLTPRAESAALVRSPRNGVGTPEARGGSDARHASGPALQSDAGQHRAGHDPDQPHEPQRQARDCIARRHPPRDHYRREQPQPRADPMREDQPTSRRH